MSADLMLVCKKRKEDFDNHGNGCIKIDETSMGDPWSDFGKMILSQYVGFFANPKITKEFIEKVKEWYSKLGHEQSESIEKVTEWLEKHLGEDLEYELW